MCPPFVMINTNIPFIYYKPSIQNRPQDLNLIVKEIEKASSDRNTTNKRTKEEQDSEQSKIDIFI